MVVFLSTTPCVVLSSFNSAVLDTLNSIDWLSSRAAPVADIRRPFSFNALLLLRTLLVFAAGRKAYAPASHVEIGGNRASQARAQKQQQAQPQNQQKHCCFSARQEALQTERSETRKQSPALI